MKTCPKCGGKVAVNNDPQIVRGDIARAMRTEECSECCWTNEYSDTDARSDYRLEMAIRAREERAG